MLMKKHKMNDLEACEMYYHSRTAASVSDEKTDFYKKSAKEIYDLVEAEKKIRGDGQPHRPAFCLPLTDIDITRS